jgi:hypothetical protein
VKHREGHNKIHKTKEAFYHSHPKEKNGAYEDP